MGIANSSDPSFKRDVGKLSTLGALKMFNDFIIPITVESWIWVNLNYLFVGVILCNKLLLVAQCQVLLVIETACCWSGIQWWKNDISRSLFH